MDERRVLAEIEQEFLRDEPLLAHRLANFEWPGPLSRRRLAGIAAAVLMLVLIASAFADDGSSRRCSAPSSYGVWARVATEPAESAAAGGDEDAADTGESAPEAANDRARTANRVPSVWQSAGCAQADRSPLAAHGAGGHAYRSDAAAADRTA